MFRAISILKLLHISYNDKSAKFSFNKTTGSRQETVFSRREGEEWSIPGLSVCYPRDQCLFHLIPFAIHPPQGWVGWSLSCLGMHRHMGKRGEGLNEWSSNRWDIFSIFPSALVLVEPSNRTQFVCGGATVLSNTVLLRQPTRLPILPWLACGPVTQVGPITASVPDLEFSEKNKKIEYGWSKICLLALGAYASVLLPVLVKTPASNPILWPLPHPFDKFLSCLS